MKSEMILYTPPMFFLAPEKLPKANRLKDHPFSNAGS